MTRAQVIDDARRWLAAPTPYVHQARRIGVGSDCIGLIGGIARDRGTPDGLAWEADKEAHDYGKQPSRIRLVRTAEKYLDHVHKLKVEIADIVLMAFFGQPQHFALISSLDPPYIIHASMTMGRVVENRLDDKWRGRIIRAYRYRGIE